MSVYSVVRPSLIVGSGTSKMTRPMVDAAARYLRKYV